jgi:thiol-disulfide isomerase/thioredoxin
VVVSNPAPGTESNCKVDLHRPPRGGSGWVLKDANGQTLRLFFDSNGDNKVDVWSYYRDGVEVYREIDSTFQGKPDQYRWLNAGGMKWGVDENRDGRIDYWKAISPEEVSQEIVQAVVRKDYARLQALMLSEAEIKTLDLPAAEAGRIRELQKAAPAKFQETCGKVSTLTAKANWVHLETQVPSCVLAEQSGSRFDLVKHERGTILIEQEGKNEWLQTGEMIQVGHAWRIIDAPIQGVAPPVKDKGPDVASDPELLKLIERLTEHDKKQPQSQGPTDAAVARHHLVRADILEQIIAKVKPEDREAWIKQLADSLSTAAQSSPPGEQTAMNRLQALVRQITGAMKGHNLAAYVTFREMQAQYALRLASKEPDFNKVQTEWMGTLTKFVQEYPKADDTPDCLLQLGMVCEFLNKDVEAKNWYGQIVKNFPDKPQAPKAAGAARRLDLEGQPLRIAGPTLADINVPYDIDQAKGKLVIVYYWASWNSQCVADFAKLKAALDAHGSKGVELVGINLDNTIEDAQNFLRRNPAPGTHLYQSGGLDGKLAAEYGVLVLPQLFLVGKDGKVLNRNLQLANLEDELKKQLK